MHSQRKLVATAVLFAALAATGCAPGMFNQVNDSLKSVSTASKAVGSARMSTAVLATAVGGFTVVQSMTAKNQAGMVAAGAGNYSLTQWADDLLNTDITAPLTGNDNVTGNVTYQSVIDKGQLVSTLKVKGAKASGYDLDLAGKFFYSPTNGEGTARAAADLTGNLVRTSASGNVKLEIERLTFSIQNPMPDTVKNFGGLILLYTEDNATQKLAIELSRVSGKMMGTASIYKGELDKGGKFKNTSKMEHRFEFSEDNPSFTETDQPSPLYEQAASAAVSPLAD